MTTVASLLATRNFSEVQRKERAAATDDKPLHDKHHAAPAESKSRSRWRTQHATQPSQFLFRTPGDKYHGLHQRALPNRCTLKRTYRSLTGEEELFTMEIPSRAGMPHVFASGCVCHPHICQSSTLNRATTHIKRNGAIFSLSSYNCHLVTTVLGACVSYKCWWFIQEVVYANTKKPPLFCVCILKLC